MSTIEHAGRILGLFVQTPELGVRDIGRRLGISKSSAQRLASQLAACDLLTRDPDTAHYRLGLRLMELGLLVQARSHLAELAQPELSALMRATREHAYLGVLHNAEFVTLAQVWALPATRLLHTPTIRMPPHHTSGGKALLAYHPRSLERLIQSGLSAATRHTITDPDTLRRHLETVRDQRLRAVPGGGRPRLAIGWRAGVRPSRRGRRRRQRGRALPPHEPITAESSRRAGPGCRHGNRPAAVQPVTRPLPLTAKAVQPLLACASLAGVIPTHLPFNCSNGNCSSCASDIARFLETSL